ncbi:MAG: hypothetical protein ACI4J1_09690, partial [Ruminiclostridium sp.]
VAFFVITLLVNVIAIYFKGDSSSAVNTPAATTAVTTEAEPVVDVAEDEAADDTASDGAAAE